MHSIAQAYHKANSNPTLQQHKNLGAIEGLLNRTNGTAFANVEQVTRVKLAAAHKDHVIFKRSRSNVILFANVDAAKQHFGNAVKRSASKLGTSPQDNIDKFTQGSNWFTHQHQFSDLYCIVKHCTRDDLYLYAVYNGTQESTYYSETLDKELTKQEVAEYMTPSAAKKLTQTTVYNKSNDVEHTVHVRAVSLQNVVSIRANNAELSM